MVDRGKRTDRAAAARLVATVADNIKILRSRRSLSLSDLASQAGLGKSTLSLLESGKGNPSVETLWAIATALDVPFSTLIEPRQPTARILRAGEGIRIASEHANHVSRLILTRSRRGSFDLSVEQSEPGTARRAEPHTRGTVEHLYVLAGRLRLTTEDSEVDLHPGDLASFAGDAPHRYEALTEGTEFLTLLDYD